jgi:hypothetical protein
MVAVATGGSRAPAVAPRSSGGGGNRIEGGGVSSARSFGNTARSMDSFSGRTAFMAFGKAGGTEKGKVPSFSISKTGAIEHSKKHSYNLKATEKKSVSRPTSSAFGPKLEVRNTFSRDIHQPLRPAFSETRPIYKNNADTKYHSMPGHAKIHTEPVNNRPKTEQTVFRNTPDRNQVQTKTPVQPREGHPLYAKTEAYKAAGRTDGLNMKKPHVSEKSLYERRPSTIKPSPENVTISQRGEITTIPKSSKSVQPRYDTPLTLMQKKQEARITQGFSESVKSKSRTEVTAATRSPQTLNRVQLDNRVREQLNTRNWITVRPEQVSSNRQYVPLAERANVKPFEAAGVKVITPQETQHVLNTYLETYGSKANAGTETEPGTQQNNRVPHLDVRSIQSVEVQADLKQAVRGYGSCKSCDKYREFRYYQNAG